MDTRFTLNRVDGTEAVVIVQDGFRRLRRRDFSASMDDCGAFSYLQPDKSASVRFYQRSGFTVIAKSEILGVCNWSVSHPSRNGGAGSWPVERQAADLCEAV